MEVWERRVTIMLVDSIHLAIAEQARLISVELDMHGEGLRVDEINEIIDLLREVKSHIDPHNELGDAKQIDLPF